VVWYRCGSRCVWIVGFLIWRWNLPSEFGHQGITTIFYLFRFKTAVCEKSLPLARIVHAQQAIRHAPKAKFITTDHTLFTFLLTPSLHRFITFHHIILKQSCFIYSHFQHERAHDGPSLLEDYNCLPPVDTVPSRARIHNHGIASSLF